jgi:uncharacterized protein (DUF1697 family)
MKRRNLALLRGINAAGKYRIRTDDVRHIFEASGCTEVQTYLQSGNVLFAATAVVFSTLAKTVQRALSVKLGAEVPVVLRSGDELEAATAENPFIKQGVNSLRLHLAFLADLPKAEAVEALDARRSPVDRFIVRGREIFLDCPDGFAGSKLTKAWFESQLGTVTSVRNWHTAIELLALSRA